LIFSFGRCFPCQRNEHDWGREALSEMISWHYLFFLMMYQGNSFWVLG